jgi:hypothetical protein
MTKEGVLHSCVGRLHSPFGRVTVATENLTVPPPENDKNKSAQIDSVVSTLYPFDCSPSFVSLTGALSTVHNVTPTQTLMDTIHPGKKNDLRRARSAAMNLAPTSTGSAKAIALIYPHLKNKLNGLAIRVPVQNASLTDLVLLVKRDTSVEEVNQVLQAGAFFCCVLWVFGLVWGDYPLELNLTDLVLKLTRLE